MKKFKIGILFALFALSILVALPLTAGQTFDVSQREIFTKFSKVFQPPYSEDTFEWQDLLEAVDEAEGTFTMVELGAGFGRWSANGANAARAKGIPYYLVLVEAEPYRAQVAIDEHMLKNNVPTNNYYVYHRALGTSTEYTFFYLSRGDWTLNTWYGQCIVHPDDPIVKWFNEKYYGFPVVQTKYGYKAVAVNQILLSTILDEIDSPIIDLLDFDIQGKEFEVIQEAIKGINSRVKRLHIGTHSHEVEHNLRILLKNNGWEKIRDYPCSQSYPTNLGIIKFTDGIQTWVNKRFL